MANVYGKKKTMRNVLIAVIAVLVIAAAIFLAVALQKDGAGMNCFRRSATAASADGVKASIVEYRCVFDIASASYANSTMTEEDIRDLQERSALEAVMYKVYEKEAKALGLSLTDEQIETCRKNVDDQITSIETYYANALMQNGNYSKAALDKQIGSYYQNVGMGKEAYHAFLLRRETANYYAQAIEDYYTENGSGIEEEALQAFYRQESEASMVTKNEDGTETENYQQGQFWYSILLYRYGMAMPMTYIPEGFIYIDFIKLEKPTALEVNDIIKKVESGELSFDELMNSDDNKDDYRSFIPGPYPIGEGDHTQLFPTQEAYQIAAALELGEFGSYVADPVTNDDGTQTVTAYLFRRAEGKMCVDGDTGLIDMDYFQGVRAYYEGQYRLHQWISDIRYEDAIYAYKGALG